MTTKRDFISLLDYSQKELKQLVDSAADMKSSPASYKNRLFGKTFGLVFHKHSTRTRASFEAGIDQLGGTSFYYGPGQLQLARGESIRDTALVLSRYLNGMMIRTFRHDDVLDFAKHASIPIINGLTDYNHPCQGLADMFTIKEKFGKLHDLKICYIGAGNNVAVSLLCGSVRLGVNFSIVTPKEYALPATVIQKVQPEASEKKLDLTVTNNIEEGVSGAHVVYTDKWTAMGQESEYTRRQEVCRSYAVTDHVMKMAHRDAIFMHCLPAQRGDEVSASVLDGPQSVVIDQAENRMHVQKAILCLLVNA